MSACPSCDYFDSKVNETRKLRNGWVKRHRRCLQDECGRRWYTYEMPAESVETDTDPELLQTVTRHVD